MGSVAWIGEGTPSPVGVTEEEREGKFLSEGRVEGAGRATSWVMGEGLQSELVMGERVEGEGPGVASEAEGRDLGREPGSLVLVVKV